MMLVMVPKGRGGSGCEDAGPIVSVMDRRGMWGRWGHFAMM